jgi:hypothetical protein
MRMLRISNIEMIAPIDLLAKPVEIMSDLQGIEQIPAEEVYEFQPVDWDEVIIVSREPTNVRARFKIHSERELRVGQTVRVGDRSEPIIIDKIEPFLEGSAHHSKRIIEGHGR